MPNINRESTLSAASEIRQRGSDLALDKSLDVGVDDTGTRVVSIKAAALLNSGVRLGERLQRIAVTAPATADTEFSVEHKLGRVPARYTFETTAQPAASALSHATLTHGAVDLAKRALGTAGSDVTLGTSWTTVASISGHAELSNGGAQLILGVVTFYNYTGSYKLYRLRLRKDASSTLHQQSYGIYVPDGETMQRAIMYSRATTGDNNTSYQLQAISSGPSSSQVARAGDSRIELIEMASLAAGDIADHSLSDHSVRPLALYPSGTAWTDQRCYFKCTQASVDLAITLHL